nr:phage tail tube protein [uncultured Rhodopila sp.]
MAQALGLVYVIWNGSKLTVEKGSSFQNGGLMQKAVINGQQVDAAQEMSVGKASVTMRLLRGDLLANVFVTGQYELQMQCDTGQTYVAPDAFITNMMNWSAGEGGKVKVEWAFAVALEVANG